MEAEALDVADARFDGVLCRWGYMLLADSARGLREAKRAPGGRIAFSTWTDPSANPWHSSIGQAVKAG
jgi:ubiquinone/menaquinone biosynthesis C-methylase UbiE